MTVNRHAHRGSVKPRGHRVLPGSVALPGPGGRELPGRRRPLPRGPRVAFGPRLPPSGLETRLRDWGPAAA